MVQRKEVGCFLLCVAMAIGSGVAQDQSLDRPQPYDCRVADLPTLWPADISPGTIEHNNFNSGEWGHSVIELTFRNGSPGHIDKLALVIEYVDAQGGLIDRVPMVAGLVPGVPNAPPSVLSPARAWNHALAPGDAASMVTVRDGVRTGYCPVRARITFATVRFTDGTVQRFSSRGWQLGPLPTVIPRLPESVPDLPVGPPASLVAKLKVSASGNVLDVVAERAENAKLVDWVRDRMKSWKFHPALVNGTPRDSEVLVLFLIHAKGMLRFPETRPVSQPITLVQFFWSHDRFPDTAGPDKWTVMYGLLPEDSVAEYPKITDDTK
jgi:hypothetical protein